MSRSEVKVMKEIDKYIFDNNIKKITKNIDFLYYSDDKYNRSKKEIFDIIFSDCSNFKLNVNILGCLENESLEFLTEFIDLIKTKEVVNNIEHLIKFTEETYENNLSILLRIFSFFELNDYNAKIYSVLIIYCVYNFCTTTPVSYFNIYFSNFMCCYVKIPYILCLYNYTF